MSDMHGEEMPAPAHELPLRPADQPVRIAGGAATASGHPAVDEVLRSLEHLDDLPVDEHVPVFEQAHEDLRTALSGAREPESAAEPDNGQRDEA